MTDRFASKISRRRVDVAFCCDEGYLQPLTVAITSVLATARDPSRLRLWLLTRTLEGAAVADLSRLVTRTGAEFNPVTLDRARDTFAGAPLSEHLTEATYYRLLLPDALPGEVVRVVYLDCDVVVRRPIEDLWNTDLGPAPTGAVVNPRPVGARQLGLAHDRDYFNAGVLLIDLARWRRERLHRRAIEFIRSCGRPLPFLDQDALNHVHAGAWHRLDLRWNQQFKFFKHPAHYLRVSSSALRRARREPFIVHYSTTTKPWHYANDHPWRGAYFRHLDRTHYRGWRPQPRNLHERVRRTMWSVVPHRWRPDVIRLNVPPRVRALKRLLRPSP